MHASILPAVFSLTLDLLHTMPPTLLCLHPRQTKFPLLLCRYKPKEFQAQMETKSQTIYFIPQHLSKSFYPVGNYSDLTETESKTQFIQLSFGCWKLKNKTETSRESSNWRKKHLAGQARPLIIPQPPGNWNFHKFIFSKQIFTANSTDNRSKHPAGACNSAQEHTISSCIQEKNSSGLTWEQDQLKLGSFNYTSWLHWCLWKPPLLQSFNLLARRCAFWTQTPTLCISVNELNYSQEGIWNGF